MCGVCEKPLRGQQKRWCSRAHAKLFYVNHYWTQARSAAKRRDRYRCVRMMSIRIEDESVFIYDDAQPCTGKPLEVNHKTSLRDVTPRVTYADVSCAHHLDGLETLCHAHHVVETNRQRAERT